MKITKFVNPFILFLSSLACGTLSRDIGTPIATIDPTATGVQATLEPMEFNTPQRKISGRSTQCGVPFQRQVGHRR